jgi:hypothetical protein
MKPAIACYALCWPLRPHGESKTVLIVMIVVQAHSFWMIGALRPGETLPA